MPDFDYTPQIGLATARFYVPTGWRALPAGPTTSHQATLSPVTSKSKERGIVVTLDFYHLHSFQTNKTQQGCAENYLDGIHRHNSSRVKMEIVDTFQSNNGPLNIYRYHSDYWRKRWVVFIVKGDYALEIEMYAHDLAAMAPFVPYLELIAQGISINCS